MKFFQEKEKKHASKKRGPHMVSIINVEESNGDVLIDSTEVILLVEIMKGKTS